MSNPVFIIIIVNFFMEEIMTDNFIDCIVNFVDTLKNVVTAAASYKAEDIKSPLFPEDLPCAEHTGSKSAPHIC